MKYQISIEAFVLAGGKSSRMGEDKGMMNLKGKPMITYVLDSLQQAELTPSIIANDLRYKKFGFPVIADEVSEKGPLGGLYTALQHTSADQVLLVSCDMPLISFEAICMLMNAKTQDFITAASVGGNPNPLFALYPFSLKETVEQQLKEDRLKMQDLIFKSKHSLVPSIGKHLPWTLENINTSEELYDVEKKWNHLL